MVKKIAIKKGLDLHLAGGVDADAEGVSVAPRLVAVVPDDFPGFVPKPEVKEGDKVLRGAPVLYDKVFPDIKLVSPVAGTVKAIVRGERRKIERVEIEPDSVPGEPVAFDGVASADADRLALVLQRSGLWALMRQRPYDIVPVPGRVPRDIFVTGIDSAPLAPDLAASVAGRTADLAVGVKALKRLTAGGVYVAVRPNSPVGEIPGAVMLEVTGPHPAGNAGVQIAAVAPVNKGETVWTLDISTLASIGAVVSRGSFDPTVRVAVTGSEVAVPRMVSTVPGADIASLLSGNLKSPHGGGNVRVISGNVLTGVNVGPTGFLRYPYRQLTVIPEGDHADEFMGWANPGTGKMSVKRSILGHFLRSRKFAPDARINGGRRSMILSGEYDKVLPMDIMAEYLVKAVLSRNIDRMECLGIYEVAPEDFALPEYVDTSKLELQKIIREGLDYLRGEVE